MYLFDPQEGDNTFVSFEGTTAAIVSIKPTRRAQRTRVGLLDTHAGVVPLELNTVVVSSSS